MSIDRWKQQASNRKKMIPLFRFDYYTGTFLGEYESVRDAERKTGIKGSDISRCYRGLIKHAGKSVWVKKESY